MNQQHYSWRICSSNHSGKYLIHLDVNKQGELQKLSKKKSPNWRGCEISKMAQAVFPGESMISSDSHKCYSKVLKWTGRGVWERTFSDSFNFNQSFNFRKVNLIIHVIMVTNLASLKTGTVCYACCLISHQPIKQNCRLMVIQLKLMTEDKTCVFP